MEAVPDGGEGAQAARRGGGPAACPNCGVPAATLAGLLFVLRDRVRGALWIFDGVDLGVHETGHLVFGLLPGRFLMVLGGTIGQLLMPAAFWWDFRRRKMPRSADACLIWLGQNLLNVGRLFDLAGCALMAVAVARIARETRRLRAAGGA